MDGRIRLRAKYRGCHQTSHVRWKNCHAEIVSGWSMQGMRAGQNNRTVGIRMYEWFGSD